MLLGSSGHLADHLSVMRRIILDTHEHWGLCHHLLYLMFLQQCVLNLAVKLLFKGLKEWVDNIADVNLLEKLTADRGHLLAYQSAWHNLLEPAQVRVAVEGEAMCGDEAAGMHSCGKEKEIVQNSNRRNTDSTIQIM